MHTVYELSIYQLNMSQGTELQDTLSDTSVRDKSLSQTDFNNCTHSNNRTIELV